VRRSVDLDLWTLLFFCASYLVWIPTTTVRLLHELNRHRLVAYNPEESEEYCYYHHEGCGGFLCSIFSPEHQSGLPLCCGQDIADQIGLRFHRDESLLFQASAVGADNEQA